MRSADARIGKEISRRPGYGGRAIVLPPSRLHQERCWSMHDWCFSSSGSLVTDTAIHIAERRDVLGGQIGRWSVL
jgi:hypothetical protein